MLNLNLKIFSSSSCSMRCMSSDQAELGSHSAFAVSIGPKSLMLNGKLGGLGSLSEPTSLSGRFSPSLGLARSWF